ncbi:MAG: mannose-1-phosphate guanylyltransferase/mannose-6-phosphate isomerase [Pseudomonadales bacterium]
MAVVPVILAGGTGSRLWPVSRELRPKQFLRLLDDQTLLQKTLLRAAAVSSEPPIVLCNEAHRFLVAEQCREISVPWRQLVLEPTARSTAPAIALAATLLLQSAQETCAADAAEPHMLVLSSDHLIEGDVEFADAVTAANDAAALGQLVTFGMTPTRAETGYGYIQVAPGEAAAGKAIAIEAFVEKPDLAAAQEYVASGDYLWNSGMFLFPAARYMAELEKYAPQIMAAVSAAVASGSRDLDFFRPGPEFAQSPALSVDYAVMERTHCASVVPAAFQWNDVGSWQSLRDAAQLDSDRNAIHGDVIAIDTHNSLLRSEDRLLATLGVDNLIVVETTDAVLVADQSRAQDVKAIVAELATRERLEHHSHRKVFRPWGSFEAVGAGQRYQAKRIIVNAGASISLQQHHHRAEHWVVVSGTAEVTRGEEVFLVSENESTYIPIGAVHRLRNPGKVALELIEVQVGAYLGEDDIVRFEDDYGRHQ